MIFVNKNWPIDLRVGCYQPFDFVNMCKAKSKLLEEFEGEVE
jgi:hypothetical protein